jgi:hypothetical protein
MTEFENRNSNRSYPFDGRSAVLDSSGAELATDVFVDAIVYPVSSYGARLSEADFSSGRITVVSGDEEFSGTVSDGKVELFSSSGRHFGTIICGPGIDRELESGRKRAFPDATLSSACVVPIMMDCVTRLYTRNGVSSDHGHVMLVGKGRLSTTIVTDVVDGEPVDTIRFDVARARDRSEEQSSDKLPRLVDLMVAVRGKSLFSVSELDSGSVLVTMAGLLDREDVCYHAHLEDPASIVYDTCPEQPEMECAPCDIGYKSEVCQIHGCSVSLQAFDLVNYRNPVKISTVGGTFSMNSPKLYGKDSQSEIEAEVNKLGMSQLGVGNGIRIEIPGVGA